LQSIAITRFKDKDETLIAIADKPNSTGVIPEGAASGMYNQQTFLIDIMTTKFSNKTAKITYKNHKIHVYDLKHHNDRWYCMIEITSPLDAKDTPNTQIEADYDCTSEDETIEKAKQHAIEWIEHKYI